MVLFVSCSQLQVENACSFQDVFGFPSSISPSIITVSLWQYEYLILLILSLPALLVPSSLEQIHNASQAR